MTGRFLQEKAARLFEAARHEGPRPGAEERAIDAVMGRCQGRRGTVPLVSRWRASLVAAAALALAAGVWFRVRSADAPMQILPETWLGRTTSEVEPEKASVLASSSAIFGEASARPPPPAHKSPGKQPSGAPRKPGPTLSDELAALGAARDALAAGNASNALKALDHYDRTLSGKKLRAEAMVLRMEALALSGQAGAASRLAERFIAAEPTHPLADRARSFVTRAESPGAAEP